MNIILTLNPNSLFSKYELFNKEPIIKDIILESHKSFFCLFKDLFCFISDP